MPQLILSLRRPAIFATCYGILLLVELTIIRSKAFQQQTSLLASAVLFDLVVPPIILFYWLIIKPTSRSKVVLLGAAIAFLRIALFVLPKGAKPFDISWPTILGLLEACVVVLAISRFRTLQKNYRILRLKGDHETALQGSLTSVFGSTLATVLYSEGQVLRFSLFGWWRLSTDIKLDQQAITTYRESGQTALTIALLLVCLVEGWVVHLLLFRWSPLVSYLLMIASGYGMLFIIADLVAAYTRPSFVEKSTTYLRLGLRWRALIQHSNVMSVSPLTEAPHKESGLLNMALLTAPNLLLTLHEPIWVQGPYGIRKQVRKIALFVDDRRSFQHLIEINLT